MAHSGRALDGTPQCLHYRLPIFQVASIRVPVFVIELDKKASIIRGKLDKTSNSNNLMRNGAMVILTKNITNALCLNGGSNLIRRVSLVCTSGDVVFDET